MARWVLNPTFWKPGSGQTHGLKNQTSGGEREALSWGLGSSGWAELPWRQRVPHLKSNQETKSWVLASFCLLCCFSIELGLPVLSTDSWEAKEDTWETALWGCLVVHSYSEECLTVSIFFPSSSYPEGLVLAHIDFLFLIVLYLLGRKYWDEGHYSKS